LLLMIVMIAFMFRIAPSTSNFLSPTQQQIAMVLLLAGAAVLVFEFTRPSDGSAHRVEDATLTRPTAIALVIPTIALVSEGFFVTVPKLIYVAIFTTVLGFLFVWVPYPKALRSFCKRLVLLDRFVRLHYFGFTSMLILLGAAAVSPVTDPAAASTNSGPDKFLVGGLLLVGLCFHIYSYVLNDVIDLDLDRTQRRRRLDPLVRGFVSREVALAFALLQFPLAFLLTLHLVHFQLIANTPAFTALGVGFLLILVYNLWGKVCPFPPFTDLIQGLGWGSLVLVGALVADKHTDLNQLLDRTGPLLAYATGFILLINGVHGGLRDLWTDKEQKKITTALFFGADRSCGEARDQPVRTTVKLRVFAFVVHTLMFSSIFYFLLRDPERSLRLFDPTEYRWAWGVTMVLFVVSNCMLWQVVKHLQPNRDFWSSMHVFVVLLAPLFLYVISWKPHDVFKVMVLSTFFVPLALQEDLMKQAMRWLYGGRSRGARPAAGPPPQPQAAA
ncbi:MAG TPA: UbiA family prenyltransferase, partial [Myxococcota bacterium]|nr:UbiA family prenyltransferase [Myxococcota bacterium]